MRKRYPDCTMLYRYAGNNPINRADPLGLISPGDVLGGIGVAMSWAEAIDCPSFATIGGALLDTATEFVPFIPGTSVLRHGSKLGKLAEGFRKGADSSGPVLGFAHGAGNPPKLNDYNQARNEALQWLDQRGYKPEAPVLSKGLGGSEADVPIGMSTADGDVGFRVEYDDRSGAHINVFDHNAPKGQQKGPHFKFEGGPALVKKIVTRFRR